MPRPKETAAIEPQTAGLETQPVFDPQREALQRAAMQDYAIKQNPGSYVRLANGAAVKVTPGMAFKYPGHREADMLANPRKYLKEPKPDFGERMPRYAWLIRVEPSKEQRRDDETRALHQAGRIRYVETSEIDSASEMPYTPYATANNQYVTCKSQILCEIMDPQLSYDKYKAWDDLAIHRVMQAPLDVQTSASVGDGLTTHIPERTETKYTEFAGSPRQGG